MHKVRFLALCHGQERVETGIPLLKFWPEHQIDGVYFFRRKDCVQFLFCKKLWILAAWLLHSVFSALKHILRNVQKFMIECYVCISTNKHIWQLSPDFVCLQFREFLFQYSMPMATLFIVSHDVIMENPKTILLLFKEHDLTISY